MLQRRAFNVVMLGAPGAGKGTQSQRLSQRWGLPHICCGDLLRETIADGSVGAAAIADVLRSGGLVSDDIVNALIRQRLERPDVAGGFILDGYPRTLDQARMLDASLRASTALVVLHLTVSRHEIQRRLAARHRDDDDAAVVATRLARYDFEIAPLVTYYRASATYLKVDAEAEPGDLAEYLGHLVEHLHGPARFAPSGVR